MDRTNWGHGVAKILAGRAQTELGAAVARYRSAFVTVAMLSCVLNVLLLAGSIYMMLVYDSVLPSHSIPTLFGLMLMVLAAYAFQGLFDAMRTGILGDVAAALDAQLSRRVQSAMSDLALRGAKPGGDGLAPMRHLDQVRGFLAGSGPATLIDLPWIVFFLGILFLLHVWLGVTALAGAAVLIGLTFLIDRSTRDPVAALSRSASIRDGMAESNLRHVEVLTALGMRTRRANRWEAVNAGHRAAQNELARATGRLGGASKVFRMFLQSLILTVGVLLVIDGKASGGVIFAASILAGRALAPVDQAIANWRAFAGARLGWHRLNELLAQVPETPAAMTMLPRPSDKLVVSQLAVAPPGTQRVTVSHADFQLAAGSALAIIGPSAAGKTSLGRALIGVWRPLRGSVRLDGAMLDQWHPDALGAFVGYLPQTVELIEGSVADNIARFDPDRDSAAVIAAARIAGVHEMIVHLPQGYDTPVGADGSALSAGQRQRIGLARALYQDPFLVLLDEPNSNLDAAGEAALGEAVAAIRARGGIVVLIAHRPSALEQVDFVLFMRDGRMEMFGPRDEVLAKITRKPLSVRQRAAPEEAALAANEA